MAEGRWSVKSSCPGKGVEIITPEGRVWSRLNKFSTAKKICTQFNCLDDLSAAVRDGDIQAAKQVLLDYGRESLPGESDSAS